MQSDAYRDAKLGTWKRNPYQLRRFRGAGTRPHLDTGKLGIFATRARGASAVAKLVTLGTIAQHRRFGGVRQWSSLEFEVRAGEPVAVGLDGEALMLVPPLHFISCRALYVSACHGTRPVFRRPGPRFH